MIYRRPVHTQLWCLTTGKNSQNIEFFTWSDNLMSKIDAIDGLIFLVPTTQTSYIGCISITRFGTIEVVNEWTSQILISSKVHSHKDSWTFDQKTSQIRDTRDSLQSWSVILPVRRLMKFRWHRFGIRVQGARNERWLSNIFGIIFRLVFLSYFLIIFKICHCVHYRKLKYGISARWKYDEDEWVDFEIFLRWRHVSVQLERNMRSWYSSKIVDRWERQRFTKQYQKS